MTRWEIGETHPSPAEWARLAAFFANYAPQAAVALTAAADVPSSRPPPPAVDIRMIEAAIVEPDADQRSRKLHEWNDHVDVQDSAIDSIENELTATRI